MNKREITKKLEDRYGPMITRKEFAQFMGFNDAHSVDRYLIRVSKIGNKYFSEDLAEILVSEMR